MTPGEEKETWQYKAIFATGGSRTILGSILLYIIASPKRPLPSIDSTCSVDGEGRAFCAMTNRHGIRSVSCIGSITDIRDDFRRLADYLKLDDGERTELFDELRKWVAVDLRADHNELATKH